MRNNGGNVGCQQGCQQDPNADNLFEAQINRLKGLFDIKFGWGTDPQLANILGISRQAISKWRKKGIPGKRLMGICKKENISRDWLSTGEGPMRRSEPKIKEAGPQYREIPAIPQAEGLDPQYFELIPVVEAYLSAGNGAFITSELVKEFLAFRKDWLTRMASNPKAVLLMSVKGPSMAPLIEDGDMVLVDTGRKRIYSDCIYAVGLGETIAIKQLHPLPNGRVRLVCPNPHHADDEVNLNEVRIIGQVIWFARELIK